MKQKGEEKKYDYNKVIANAQQLLKENTEWIDRFDGYAKVIHENKDFLSCRENFHIEAPFQCYTTVSDIKKTKSDLELSLRYMGQRVAILKANSSEITISTEGFDANNKRDFECNITLNGVAWSSADAERFRSYFQNTLPQRNPESKGNEEHYIESLLKMDFSESKGDNKLLKYLQPVLIKNIYFSMPTPLKASDHKELEYSGPNGGGVDILARTDNGPHARLTVIEVKDENVKTEPPQAALKQAIEYAVFLRELLRSKSGKEWWHIFGFGNEAVPDNLIIRCACAMPDDDPDKSFEKVQYKISDDKGNDTIECHYIYFKMKDGMIDSIDSSLNRTAKNK